MKLLLSFKKLGFFNKQKDIRAYWWNGMDNKNFGDLLTPYLIKKHPFRYHVV